MPAVCACLDPRSVGPSAHVPLLSAAAVLAVSSLDRTLGCWDYWSDADGVASVIQDTQDTYG